MIATDTDQWVRNAADEYAVRQGCYFNERQAARVVSFISQLRHTIGQFAGQQFVPMDWQREDILYPLFGWMAEDGTRRFKVAYIEVPKKNGKSTLCSGISLYLLMGDKEAGAEIYIAAADRQQAGIVYKGASDMVKESPSFQNYVMCIDSQKRISMPSTNSVLRVVSSDAFRQEGLNIHGLIFDELHAQPNRNLYDSLRYGGASRRQSLHVNITTAGYDRHSICYEQHKRAKGVLDGTIQDETYFGFIAAADKDDDWQDPEVWWKANPSMGITINAKAFKSAALEAAESPQKENTFKRYRLNIWTESEVKWLPMDKWDTCPSEEPDLTGCPCFGGLDLSTKRDISALALVFKLERGYATKLFYWISEEEAKKRSRMDHVPYVDWIGQGYIQATPGGGVDHDRIRGDITDLYNTYNIRKIGMDMHNAAQLGSQLVADGFEVQAYSQSYKDYTAACSLLETLVIDEELYHYSCPVLRWMATNTVVDEDPRGNGRIRPTKKKSPEKIDGIVATLMGLGVALVEAEMAPEVFMV